MWYYGGMTTDELTKKVLDIIIRNLSMDYKVFLFGSWAKGNNRATSDLDIGILGKDKIDFPSFIKIKEEIDNLPTLRSIDLVDLNTISENFKNSILSNSKILA